MFGSVGSLTWWSMARSAALWNFLDSAILLNVFEQVALSEWKCVQGHSVELAPILFEVGVRILHDTSITDIVCSRVHLRVS